MMSPEVNDIEPVYNEARSRTGPAERSAYLASACAGNPSLRARVEALLKAHDRAGRFLETPPPFVDVPVFDESVTEQPGMVIGRYKLLEKIGEGGMAVVYMAEQTEPIRRKVALKIIKLGMDTRQVIARFEAERQALALMDHPSIAKVLDAGATETGRPYFVMELVQGVSITEYCDKNNLNTKDRLTLFLQVCNAVQHAHQKGIIHRDIKPSNVMVTHHDGKPVPKVIDFGIAKATNQRLTEKTLFTRYAHLIGTPAYMSPEQAELSDLDIDTRSDIYSLGVLLYELLTGTTPFSEEELRKAGYLEMQRVIREQEPVKPSTKLSTLGETLTDIAKHRNSTPDLLRKAIRGDLDWIVMKSLEKDRARRYETANGLAEDVRRHLEHEPVLARGPGATYRLRKFLRRHRSQAIAGLAFGVLIALVAVVLPIWNRNRLQLAEAEGLRHKDILDQARDWYAKGDRQAALETIKNIFYSRHVGPEAQLLHAGILVDNRRSEETMTTLQSLLNDRPEIAGAAHALWARILWESQSPNAEKLKEIEEHRRQAEALLPETAEAYFLRAMTAVTVKEQLAALDRALELDPAHYESYRLRAFTYYASRKYAKMENDAVAMVALRSSDVLGYSLRAIARRELGRYREAIVDYDRALARAPNNSVQYLDLSGQRCEVFLRMGDHEGVIAEAQRCLKLRPGTPVFQYHLFCALTALGDYDTAATLFRQIIRSGLEARRQFENWCAKHVFDTLEAGQSWHPPDRQPAGAAFLPMVEAEETYHQLSAKARRVTTGGFSAHWSPDGMKLAFSMGVHGYSGVAIFDPATKETDLLIAPGKDPRWSPDGRYIAFVRDCQALRVPELTVTERWNQPRWTTEEELWVMRSDGTEARRLARGGWPSWSQDSMRLWYHSRVDNAVYSISIESRDAQPKRAVACSTSFPSVSADDRRVAYAENGSLKVRDLTSDTSIVEWRVPFAAWGGPAWSPTGNELCLDGSSLRDASGLWIYHFDKSEPVRALRGPITPASWSADGSKLVFGLGAPYFEIWTADLDPRVSTFEALGQDWTLGKHLQEMVSLYTRRIETDPAEASNYLYRAEQYQYLREETKARADMRRYGAILNPESFWSFWRGGPRTLMRIVNGPFGGQLLLFVERQEDGLQVLRVAFGQEGRCEMKSIEIPMVVTSLLGLCFLSRPDTAPARGDLTFGAPVNLGPAVNSGGASWPIISPDGLEVYFLSPRPGGYGDWDIWMSKRAGQDDPWGRPMNLAHLNSASWEFVASIAPDGLTLYIEAGTGTWGDLYTATRATKDAPWGPRVNLGPILNTSGHEGAPIISPDDLELFFYTNRPGNIGLSDIYVTTRATVSDPWGPPVSLGPTVNSSGDDFCNALSRDGLVLFMVSAWRQESTNYDVWIVRRPYKGAVWSTPVKLGPSFNTPYYEALTSVSSDGRWAYFSRSPRGGDYTRSELWTVPIIPILDSNDAGK